MRNMETVVMEVTEQKRGLEQGVLALATAQAREVQLGLGRC